MQNTTYRAAIAGAALTLAIALFIVGRVAGLIGAPIRFGRGEVRNAEVESASPTSSSPIESPRPKTPCLEDVDWRTVSIELECSECYGMCPNYRVVIASDGHVNYTGRTFVKTVGPATAEIGPAKVRELVERFLDAQFFDLDDAYADLITDLPSTWLELRVNGQEKRVLNYWDFDPQSTNHVIHRKLSELERSINSAVDVESWIGTPAEIEAMDLWFPAGIPGRTGK